MRAEGLRSAHAGPFTLEVPLGECLAITGPSGSGKSLLLRMLADLDPHDGEAWLGDAARSGMTGPAWRSRVRYAAAEPGWWLPQVGAHFTPPPLEAAALLGLDPTIFDQATARCSTGERARLGLLRALADGPAVLLADEPTGALDAAATALVETMLRARLDAGLVLILVTHDPAQAQRLGTLRRSMAVGRLL